MGKKDTPKIPVPCYKLSIHYGICQGPAELKELYYGEESFWLGDTSVYTVIGINQPDKFGGFREEGGLGGVVHFYPGAADQKMSDFIAEKHERTPDTMSGYRGIASVFLTEFLPNQSVVENPQEPVILGNPLTQTSTKGFYYSANQPFFKGIWAKVTRIPDTWRPDIARIPRVRFGTVGPMHLSILIDQSPGIDTANFNLMRNAICAVIDECIAYKTKKPEAKFNFAFLQHNSIFFPTKEPYSFGVGDAQISDMEDCKTWIQTMTKKSSAGDTRLPVYRMIQNLENGLPDDDEEDPFERRVAIWATDGQQYNKMDEHSSPNWLDFYNQIGIFDKKKGRQVDSYTVVYDQDTNPFDPDVPPLFANQPLGPIGLFGDQQSVTDAMLACVRPKSSQPDMNPAHIIYECLTDIEFGMGAPTSMLNLASFEASAEKLYEEQFGLSMMWAQQTTIESFVNEVLDHIQAVLYVDPRTGLINLDLIRYDYDPDDLFELNPDNCKVTNFQRKLIGDLINEIVVTWTNPENEQEQTVTAQDLGNIAIQGGVVSDSRNYYGVRTEDLANELAYRDLAAACVPLASMEIEANRLAWNFVPGQVVKLNYPELGFTSMIIRLGQIDYGRPGEPTIKINAIEDVWGQDAAVFTQPGGRIDTSTGGVKPQQPTNTDMIPLNYYIAANLLDPSKVAGSGYPDAFVGALVASNTPGCYQYDLYVDNDVQGTRSIIARGELPVALPKAVTSVIDDSSVDWTNGTLPKSDAFLILQDQGEGQANEICLITGVSGGNITIKRGMLDTTPKYWPAGTPMWVLAPEHVFIDTHRYSDGEEVTHVYLTRTSKGRLSLSSAPFHYDRADDRIWCPTRPANVAVEGDMWGPVDIQGVDPVNVSWATRNRLTEDSVPLAWDAAGVAMEAGQKTIVYVKDLADNILDTIDCGSDSTVAIPASTFTSGVCKIVVQAEKDGLVSYQSHEIIVNTGVSGYGLGYGLNYGGA